MKRMPQQIGLLGFVVGEEASLRRRRRRRGGGENPQRPTTGPSRKASEFWTGGPKAYRDAMTREHDARFAELRAQLAQCAGEEERERLQAEIRATETEYEKKLKEIEGLLF